MTEHDLATLERDLRTAITLKADDLLFTLGGEEGARLQDALLGHSCHGDLATDVFLTEEELQKIDLGRFQIATQVQRLHAMLESGSLGLSSGDDNPDPDLIRQDALDFLEHFLSTLPHVALGGWDATSVRNGSLRRFYDDCSAWANLIEAIRDAFHDGGDLYSLRVADLARLSGVELRTMRNRVGPSKPIRSTPERKHRSKPLTDPSFVGVNTVDSLNWLSERRDFSIRNISPGWAERRIEEASERRTIGRSAVVLGLINVGSVARMAGELGWAEEKIRQWAEAGPSGVAEEAAALAELTGLNPATYSARCAA